MKTNFFGYKALDNRDLFELIKDAVLVLDTNVVLNLFRFEKRHSDVLMSLFAKPEINKRIFVPHHVALEFYENVDEVAEEPLAKFDEISKLIRSFKKDIDGSSRRKNIDTIYAPLKNSITRSIDEILNTIKEEQKTLKKSFDKNRILIKVEDVLGGKIGDSFDIDSHYCPVKKPHNLVKY